jgi:hypothetical protein
MLNKKKAAVSIAVLMCMLFSSSIGIVAYAAEPDDWVYSPEIPGEMQPYTLIEYVTNQSYVIIEGGPVKSPSKIEMSDVQRNLLEQAKRNGSYYTAIHEEYPSPVKGVRVQYSSDGFIHDIVFPEGVENPLLQPKQPLSGMVNAGAAPVILVDADGTGIEMEIIAVWGNHRNTLYKVLNTPNNKGRYGIGRATTFNDTIGQADIVLEKGHVATSLKYDNIDVRTVVGVVAMVNGSSNPRAKDMIKADAGGMPDAILDIWKTGVEYWGYTWNSSFSMPGTTQYSHNCNIIT